MYLYIYIFFYYYNSDDIVNKVSKFDSKFEEKEKMKYGEESWIS